MRESRFISRVLQPSFCHLKKPKLMSQIYCIPESIPRERADSVSLCKSQKLMLGQGLIKHVSPGIHTLMPLTVRSLGKLCDFVDTMMNKVNAEKVLFPTLVPENLMKTSGRWENNSNLFKLKDRNSHHYCLGATHEEIATSLLSKLHLSYKSLPVCVYQISTKFRDEMNPKLGLLRGREFIMKDMYSFDSSEENAKITYKAVCDVYHEIFNYLGVEHVKVAGSSGDIGGKISHEFHFPSEVGEDVILYCTECKNGYNAELASCKEMNCVTCSRPLKKCNAIEVGHAFLLGTTYSEPFQAEYDTSTNTNEKLQMGCYGLGITRILAACVECLSSAENIRWPLPIAPYYLSVITPKKGSKEEPVRPFAETLANSLNGIDWLESNVIVDDRTNLTIGRRLLDSCALGIPYSVVVGGSAQGEVPKIEVNNNYSGSTNFYTHAETIDFFNNENIFKSET